MSISERATAGIVPKPEPKAVSFGRIVTDGEIGKALDFLRDSAHGIGEAKARLIKAGHMVKHVEALLLLSSEERSIEAKKAAARISQKWIDATNEEAEAAGEFEKLKALREAADAKIEAWRTESSNYRGMKV